MSRQADVLETQLKALEERARELHLAIERAPTLDEAERLYLEEYDVHHQLKLTRQYLKEELHNGHTHRDDNP